MKYSVKTFRAAGLDAKWTRTRRGAPIIVVKKPHQKTWVGVDQSMFDDMKKEGIADAFERHTLLVGIFSIPL
jgi:hypothetical protein